VFRACTKTSSNSGTSSGVDEPFGLGGQHRDIATGDNQSSECTVAQNAVADAQAEFDEAFLLLKDASTDHQRLQQILDLVKDAKESVDAAKAKAQRICNTPTKTTTVIPPPPSVDGGGALPPTPVSPGPSSSGNSSTAMLTPPAAVPAPPAFPQPPTASYNSGSNVCNPTPPAPPNPANVCNPPTPASQPGNICNPSGNAPTAMVNSGQCNTNNGLTTCTDASGNSCTTSGNFCDPTAPQPTPPKPNQAPLNLKPATQMASTAPNPSGQTNQSTSVPTCSSKPPYLPWGGQGSATITVSGGQPCGVGWHDTPGGPGGVTVLDSMSVSSPPSHGSLRPQDQHVIIFTPAPGYKGQDSFTLSMQEHNGGRRATLSVQVSVTIQ
jgi:hypothetical protein